MGAFELSRVVIAGLSGDGGKTLVALGLVGALRKAGLRVSAFKKGPDFIDAAWLARASGQVARNLDTYLMPEEAVVRSVARSAGLCDIAVTEGNRGLFDGFDDRGSHSTAQLAKLISSPVVLVVNTAKVTRTVAALVKGCIALDPDLPLVGVVLNRVGTVRQENLIRHAIEKEVGIPVLGAVPRLRDQHLPSRHLGLVTSVEHPEADAVLERVAEVVAANVDVDALLRLAKRAPRLNAQEEPDSIGSVEKRVRIGVLKDRAFSFYYPENLEALEAAGAEIVEISPLADDHVPDISALYAGGGFPEVYAKDLSANVPFREALADRVREGLPVWAECGGLMYLSEKLVVESESYPMVGVLPVVVEQTKTPQGHGYVEAQVDRKNPFLATSTRLLGHEFHYSRLVKVNQPLSTALNLKRGVGVGQGRDGIQESSVLASYTHIHALGVPGWGESVVKASCRGGPS